MIDTHESIDLSTLVRDKIDAWHAGQTPDASRLLAEHPALRNAKSLVMDLALAEYSLRTAAGDDIVKSDFCNRFPDYRQSIARLLEVHEFLDQCPQFAVNDATRWPAPGDEFLGFEIVEPLGRGGMARVFLARQPELGNRQVVIKVSRFASREAHTLGKLSHPSIMPVFSVERDESAGWTAICMPLLGAATGVDLLDAAFAEHATRNGALVHRVASATRPLAATAATATESYAWNLPYSQAVARIGLQLAEALATAHAAGILHRDIKPSNVLFAWSGRPILLDFNLSSDADSMLQGVGGTLAYMAPELIASVLTDKGAAARQFDSRYDIYSLGAVLYELLTGRLPAKPADAERLPLDAYQPWLECKRQTPAFPPPSADIGSIDEQLQQIVLKCLAFDAAERFATATGLVSALQDYLRSALPSAASHLQPSSQALPVRSPERHHRRAIVATGLGILGAGLGFAAYYTTRRPSVELLYEQAIDEYNASKYEQAVTTFTRCLEQKPGWTEALFGRGQSFRKLEQWREARTDYSAMRTVHPAWSSTLAGYCSMRLNEDSAAWGEFYAAHKLGQRQISFLMNYARVEFRRQRPLDAVKHYTEVLDVEPGNIVALRNRALAGVTSVWNDKKKLVPTNFLDDARECYRLAPDSIESPLCAAIGFGDAARKDLRYQQEAINFLTCAIKNGLPIEAVSKFPVQLNPLLSHVDQSVKDAGRHDSKYVPNLTPPHDFSDIPRWDAFLAANRPVHALAHNP